jgi:predicted ATP-binding protein involved in virulence
MRLDHVYIDGFKNLKGVDIDFDEERLTTVVIDQNGAGKSNLIEAITDVFRFVDHCCPARVRPHRAVDLVTPDAVEDGINPRAFVGRTG